MRWTTIVCFGVLGCAGAGSAPSPQPPVPVATSAAPTGPVELGLAPGESMTFEVKLGGMVAGEAQLAVGQIGRIAGHRALVVKSRAETAGAAALLKSITDETTTVIDADTGRPLQLDANVVVDGKTTVTHAEFTGAGANVTLTKGDSGGPGRPVRIAFARGITAYDAHSAMAQLRGWHAEHGARRSVYVVGGKRLWRVDMTYVGVESIGSAMGNRRAVHLDGLAFHAKPNLALESKRAARTFSVWLTDDADRVPLKIVAKTELGDIAMDLTEYERGSDAAHPQPQ